MRQETEWRQGYYVCPRARHRHASDVAQAVTVFTGLSWNGACKQRRSRWNFSRHVNVLWDLTVLAPQIVTWCLNWSFQCLNCWFNCVHLFGAVYKGVRHLSCASSSSWTCTPSSFPCSPLPVNRSNFSSCRIC